MFHSSINDAKCYTEELNLPKAIQKFIGYWHWSLITVTRVVHFALFAARVSSCVGGQGFLFSPALECALKKEEFRKTYNEFSSGNLFGIFVWPMGWMARGFIWRWRRNRWMQMRSGWMDSAVVAGCAWKRWWARFGWIKLYYITIEQRGGVLVYWEATSGLLDGVGVCTWHMETPRIKRECFCSYIGSMSLFISDPDA